MSTAVPDANVLASGFTHALGPSGRLLDNWRAGGFELVVSEHILNELERTFTKRYFAARLTPDVGSEDKP